MTTDEMLQLLLKNQERMEGKIDGAVADIRDLKEKVFFLSANIDGILITSKETRTDIATFKAETSEKLDKLAADFKWHKRATQSAISELQANQQDLEDKLDKAS